MPSTRSASLPWALLDLAALSLVTVNRTGAPAGIRVLPSEPVTFSMTTAVTTRPTVSVRELIESSKAA